MKHQPHKNLPHFTANKAPSQSLLEKSHQTGSILTIIYRLCALLVFLFIINLLFFYPRNIAANSSMRLPRLGDASALTLSPSQEQLLGKIFMNAVSQQMPLIHNSLSLAYLNNLGVKLTSHANPHGQTFHFFIVNNPAINAFAGPGGYIGVYRGLIAATDSESELAGVLAHEIAHVTQRHIARGMAHARALRLPLLAGTLAAAILGASGHGNAASAAVVGTMATAGSNQLAFSRSEEKEADTIGLQTMYKAHYDPHAMKVFLKKMQSINQDYEHHHYNLSSHPAIIERLTAVSNIANSMPPHHNTSSSLQYYLLKAQLDNLHRQPKPRAKPSWLLRAKQNALQIQSSKSYLQQKTKKNSAQTIKEKKHLAAQYNDALALFHAGQLKYAQIISDNLLFLDPHQIAFQLLQANITDKLGHKKSAQQMLKNLYLVYPDYRPVIFNYLTILLDNKQTQSAIAIVMTQLLNKPQQAIWYNILSKIYNDRKEYIWATIYHAHASLLQARPQRALAQLHQLTRTPTINVEQKDQAQALIKRAQALAHHIQIMLPKRSIK